MSSSLVVEMPKVIMDVFRQIPIEIVFIGLLIGTLLWISYSGSQPAATSVYSVLDFTADSSWSTQGW